MKPVYKKAGKAAFFIVLVLIAALCYITAAGIPAPNRGDTQEWLFKGVSNIRYGIDIKGGVSVEFVPQPAKGYSITNSDIDQAATVIGKRLDDRNIADRTIVKDYNKKRVLVSWPWQGGSTNYDPETAIKELGSMASLTFKDPSGNVIMSGSDVKSATARPVTSANSDIQGSYYVELALKSSGQQKFATATAKLVGKSISIYLDKTLISNPTVNSAINDSTCIIEGSDFTAASAASLANTINAGALPFAMTSSNYSAISPTLGTNALNVMLLAGLVAFLLIMLFMVLYYRLPGFIAVIALSGHLAGMVLSMLLLNYTLTLPGIAGMILSIGMGVDCNIITAERIKEQLREGRTLDGAIDQGFDMSFTAIFDGNITVLIAGAILMWLGSAAVKSFGFTLVAGVVFNFLMGIIASRFMLKSVSKYSFLRNKFLYGGAREKKPFGIDFIGHRHVYYTISISLIVIGVLVSAIFGIKTDIQFKGGTIIKYSYSSQDTAGHKFTSADLDQAKNIASQVLGGSVDTSLSAAIDNTKKTTTQLIQFDLDKNVSNTQVEALYTKLTAAFKNDKIARYDFNTVGPQEGQDFFLQSALAVLLASLLIIIYIWIRFRHIGGLPAGLTAFIALLHDLAMAFVAFSIFRIALNDNFIAVLLTILGYSINDTIVIYDRIRENRRVLGPKAKFTELVNLSINQSFTRSINTTLVVFMSITVVLIFSIIYNIESIRSFALPMLVGVVTGAYSTICIAGPLWVTWENHKTKSIEQQRLALKAAKEEARKAKYGASGSTEDASDANEADTATAIPANTASNTVTPAKPNTAAKTGAKKKKKKKR